MTNMNWKILSVIVVASMLFLVFPLASAERKMSIEVQTDRPYYSFEIGDYTRYASFYLFQGEGIRWWQGGAIFLYYLPSEVAREKIDTLTRHMLELFKDLGFILVSGVVKVTYVKIVYGFDGVLEYEGYYFADGDGRITIEWAIGKPLNITIEAKATIDASTAEYAGRGDWRIIQYQNGRGILWPELQIPMPEKEVKVLVVPREGFSGITIEVHNYWGTETRIFYLGGGAAEYVIKPNTVGYILKDSGTFWGRYPVIEVVYKPLAKEVYYLDWFWSSKIRM